jgi:hypothetical protein
MRRDIEMRWTSSRAVTAALLLSFALGGIAFSPAAAQDRDRHDDRGRHEERRPVRRPHHPSPPAWGYDAPSYVQAPPPVVYAPPAPPEALFGVPGISLQLNFR